VAHANINIPSVLFGGVADCVSSGSCELIDKYYRDIVLSVNDTCRNCIPCRRSHGGISEYVTPGWIEFVARSAFLDWVVAGKPRSGLVNMIMRRTRSQFKLALRYCKQHEVNIRSDVLAKSLSAKDYNKFWKSISRHNNSKAVNYAFVLMAALETFTLLIDGVLILKICVTLSMSGHLRCSVGIV